MDSRIPVLFDVALTELMIEDPNGFEGESPIGRVNVVVFPPFWTELTPEDALGGIKAVWPFEITVILRLGDFTGILDWWCPWAEADDTLDEEEMVDDGEPNRRGAEQDEDEDGWGDVDKLYHK